MQEVYENFNLMSDVEFKAWMLNTDLIEKEKYIIMHAYKQGVVDEYGDTIDSRTITEAEDYYNDIFNTKE